jgi:hypothetical protein
MKPRHRIEAALCGFFIALPLLIYLLKGFFK